MVKRCQWRGINTHPTRDAITFSDGAAEQAALALFKPGHNATCKCMADGTDPAQCDGLYVTDENGEHLATLYGATLRARGLQNGALAVYRATVSTGDAAIDRTVELMRERLAAINKANAQFWAAREEQ
jgi:hypothetical protein